MKHKLLVVTAGTIAAGVGLELQKQLDVRPESKLNIMVRYLDIATTLPSMYGGNIFVGEWQPMQISRQYMDAVLSDWDKIDPKMQKMLYRGLPPRTEGAGGGGVRYNGAGAVLSNRNDLEGWLADSMDTLVQRDKGRANLSVALIVSPVGATGSGSMERLIELILSASVRAGLAEEVHCDVFILQPGTQGVSDLGLANTFALYAEMAASRIMQNNINYKGRTIMMGWGTDTRTTSLQQLQETTATLVRILNDPSSGLYAEYRQREVDHSALIGRDRQTLVPTHLSTTTCITITLGDLEEQIIRYDTSRILSKLVYGDDITRATEGEANIFDEALLSSLSGNTARERYVFLLDQISKVLELKILGTSEETLRRLPVNQQRAILEDDWLSDKNKLRNLAPKQFQDSGKELYTHIVDSMKVARQEALGNGVSLIRIQREYEVVRDALDEILTAAQRYKSSSVNTEESVQQYMKDIGRMGARRGMENTLTAMKDHIKGTLHTQTAIAGRQVLRALKEYCGNAITKLTAIRQEAPRPSKIAQDWETAPPLNIQATHPLHLAALTPEQTRTYYEQVSVFALPEDERDNFFEKSEDAETQNDDPLARLRAWLREEKKLGVPFTGDFQAFRTLILAYTTEKIRQNVQEHTILDVLLQSSKNGEDALYESLTEAALKAQALINFNPKLASNRVEKRHVCAQYKPNQLTSLQNAISKSFKQGGCTPLLSEDPTEITVIYYIDGLPMSSITEFTGRCLKAFLDYRGDWYEQTKNGSLTSSDYSKGNIPVYSGKDTEDRVIESHVVRQVYSVRDKFIVEEYDASKFSELQ